tara:strand:+ start:2855 stop:3541 length:687 start_codon:yes stop_codon:yes gene_type:complete
MTLLITVQGNIAAGKSTLVKELQRQYAGDARVCFLQEPVDEWENIKNADGESMISLFYGDQEKYGFSFQMMAYISRLASLKRAISSGVDVVISERSLETDRQIFAKMLYDDGKIEDVNYQIYLKWFEEFQCDFPVENVVYVKTDPEVSAARVKKRAREGEVIPIEYLKRCNDYHNKWIETVDDSNLCIINGNIDIDENKNIITTWKQQIDNFIAEKRETIMYYTNYCV